MRKVAFLTTPVLALALVFGNAVVYAGDDGGSYSDSGKCPYYSNHNNSDDKDYGYSNGGGCPYQNSNNGKDQNRDYQNNDYGYNHTNQQSRNHVTIQNYAYSPANLMVPMGTTVTWTNRDSVPHTVTAIRDEGPKSGVLQPGQSYSYTFDHSGMIAYYCMLHPEMKAAVTVGQAPSHGKPTTPAYPSSPSHPDTTPTAPAPSSPSAPNNSSSANASATSNSSTNNYNTYYTGSKDTTSRPVEPTAPAPTPYHQPTTTTVATQPTAPVAENDGPVTLPKTGAGAVAAVFVPAAVIGSGLYYLYLRRKLAE